MSKYISYDQVLQDNQFAYCERGRACYCRIFGAFMASDDKPMTQLSVAISLGCIDEDFNVACPCPCDIIVSSYG